MIAMQNRYIFGLSSRIAARRSGKVRSLRRPRCLLESELRTEISTLSATANTGILSKDHRFFSANAYRYGDDAPDTFRLPSQEGPRDLRRGANERMNHRLAQDTASWRSLSDELVRVPIGELSPLGHAEIEQAFRYWSDQRQNGEAVKYTFDLLERMISEAGWDDSLDLGKRLTTESCLNRAIRCWCLNASTRTTKLNVEEVFQNVESFAPLLLPNSKTYELMITGASGQVEPNEAPAIADNILEKMIDNSKKNESVVPNARIFAAVQSAWTNSGLQQAVARNEALLEQMKQLQVEPAIMNHNGLLLALARSSEPGSAEQAEAILSNLENWSAERRDQFIKPDSRSYNYVAAAFAGDGNTEAAKRIVTRIQDLGSHNVRPKKEDFAAVVDFWVKSDEPTAAHRADGILGLMFELGQRTETADMIPDRFIWPAVVATWAKSAVPDAPERAEAILQKLLDLYWAGYEQAKPNVYTFSVVINAWAQSKRPDSADRAQALLQQMLDLADSTGDEELRPNTISFNTALNSIANSGEADAPLQAETLLQRMQGFCDAGVDGIRPDAVSFNTVLKCWSNVGHRDSMLRAMSILQLMRDLSAAGNEDLRPTAVTYRYIFDAINSSGVPDVSEKCWSLWQQMKEDGITPDFTLYHCVLEMLASSGNSDAPRGAQHLLCQMKEDGVVPNRTTFHHIMNAWAHSGHPKAIDYVAGLLDEMMGLSEQTETTKGLCPSKYSFEIFLNTCISSQELDAARRAEFALEKMITLQDGGNDSICPDVHTFNKVLKGLSKSKEVGSSKRQVALLRRMRERYKSGMKGVKPDVFSYSIVLECLARSGESPALADTLFGLMIEDNVKPDMIVYTALLGCWITSSEKGYRERVNNIITQMHEFGSAGDETARPTAMSYNVVLDGLLATETENTPERSEHIVKEMMKRGIRPSARSYSILISTWARSGRRDSPEQVETILQRMRDQGLTPNEACFNAVMTMWARSGRPDGAEKAKAIFMNMQRLSKNGHGELQPNSVSCNAILNAYSRAGDATRAEEMLEYMTESARNGKTNLRPTTVSYNTVLAALANSRDTDVVQRAESLYNNMQNRTSEQYVVLPDIRTINTFISVLAKSKHHDGGPRAEQMLEKAVSLHEAGNFSCRPNGRTFSAVMHAWANSTRKSCGEKAELYLRRMESAYKDGLDLDCRPDQIAYNTALGAWAKSRHPQSGERALALLQEMKNCGHFKPDIISYNTTINALARCRQPESGDQALALLEEMKRSRDPSRRPNDITYRTVLKALSSCSSSRQKDRQRELREEMKSLGMRIKRKRRQ